MPDQLGLLHDYRYGYLVPTENIRAAIRLLHPDHMTAVVVQQLKTALEAWEPIACPLCGEARVPWNCDTGLRCLSCGWEDDDADA